MAENTSTGRGQHVSSGSGTGNVPQMSPSEQRRNDSPGRTLMFVDSTADQAQSREAIRVHVMRESHRVRRLQQGQSQPSSNVGQLHIWNAAGSHDVHDSRVSTQVPRSHEFEGSTRPPEASGMPTAGPSTSASGLPVISHAVPVPSAETTGSQRQRESLSTSSAIGDSVPPTEAPGQNVKFLVSFCTCMVASQIFPVLQHKHFLGLYSMVR